MPTKPEVDRLASVQQAYDVLAYARLFCQGKKAHSYKMLSLLIDRALVDLKQIFPSIKIRS